VVDEGTNPLLSAEAWTIDWLIHLDTENYGRKSGKPRLTAIEHRRIGGAHYIVSAWGSRADWYQNILKEPHVYVWAGRRKFDAVAEILDDAEKREALRARWGGKERRAVRTLFRLRAEPTEEQINELLRTVIIVRLRPVQEERR
jgi:deazaflavin-dependent oxidoreductase (nitroreductase family)